MNFSKHFLLALSVGVLLVAAPISPVAAGKDTKLKGTLTIDFTLGSTVAPNPEPAAGFQFTVTNAKKVQGIEIPEAIRGGTFALNQNCPNGVSNDTTAGYALLRLADSKKGSNELGTVFQALVTSGAVSCLFFHGATDVNALLGDPFLFNALHSALGDQPREFGGPHVLAPLVEGNQAIATIELLEQALGFRLSHRGRIPVELLGLDAVLIDRKRP